MTENGKKIILKTQSEKATSSNWYGPNFEELSVEFVRITKERVQLKVIVLTHIYNYFEVYKTNSVIKNS